MRPHDPVRDRVLGCVLGLALGDALGAPFDGRRSHDIAAPLPAFQLPWMGLVPGTTTAGTAMARNLVRSLASRGGFDPDDLVRRHLEWLAGDPRGAGALTRRVLRRAAASGGTAEAARSAARAAWERRGPEVSAGNGSVRYCAPLGAAFARRPERLFEAAPRLSALTHHDDRCGTAVLAVTLAVAAVIRDPDPARAVSGGISAVVERPGGEELEFLVEAVGVARSIDGPDRRFCLFTAAAGLQALLRLGADAVAGHPGAVEHELRRVVALGGDTGANAAVAGALLGAAAGSSALPEPWLATLVGRRSIEREAEAIVPLAAVRG
jgi:ADP-ribosylglycohydrolase